MKVDLLIIAFASLGIVCGCKAQVNTVNSQTSMKNKEIIMAFYNKALTVNSDTNPAEVLTPILSEEYISSGSVETKNAQQLIGQLEFFWNIVPDLKWVPQQIINEGDTYVVRSIASGTPNGDFMGAPTDGSASFEIMTIDVHTVQGGKIVGTYHVEDWVTAMKQLTPKPQKKADALSIAGAFMDAMGKGDMETMQSLMHEDMVWQNAGDSSLPWIGPWSGKKAILEDFMPLFGAGFKTIKWEPVDALSSGDTAAFFGQMIGELTNTNQQTEEFTYALRVKVKDGQVVLWNWFEDSYEVSRAFHGK